MVRSTTRPADPHEELLDALAASLDDLTEEVVDRLRRQIPEYAAADAPDRSDVATVVRLNLQAWVDAVRSAQVPSAADIAPFEVAARRRADDGHPLAALLHAYRVGASVAWERLARITRERGVAHLDGALDITGDILRYIDIVSTAVTEAYVDERSRLELDEVEQARRRFNELLTGVGIEAAVAAHSVLHLVAVADPIRPRAVLRWFDRAHAPARSGVPVGTGVAVGGHAATAAGDGVIVLVPADLVVDPRELVADLRVSVGALAAVWVPPVPNAELTGAVEEAERILAFAPPTGDGDLVTLEDRILTAVVHGWGGRTIEVLRRIVAPLDEHDRTHRASLVATVRALAETGTIAAAAERLHLHRNSVAWRCARIAELTGLDPQTPRDLLVLAAAVR